MSDYNNCITFLGYGCLKIKVLLYCLVEGLKVLRAVVARQERYMKVLTKGEGYGGSKGTPLRHRS